MRLILSRCGPLLSSALVLLATPIVAQDRQPFTIEDALNVASAAVQAMTPDGRYLAVTRTTQRDRKDVDHLRFGDPTYVAPSLGEVLVIDTETGEQRSLFDHKVQTRAFDWSPDGSRLAFLIRDNDDFVLHTYDVSRDRLSRVSVQSPLAIAANSPLQWRPDGSGVLLALRPAGWADSARAAYTALAEGPVIVQDSRNPFLAWDAVRNLGQRHLPAVVDLSDGRVTPLVEDAVGALGITQSTDGRYISFTRVTPTATSYTRREGTEYAVRVHDLQAGSAITLLTRTDGRLRIDWNEAGDVFAYADEGAVFVQGVTDGEPRNLTPAPDTEEDSTRTRYTVTRWRPDGGALLVSSESGWHLLDVTTGAIDLVLAQSREDSTAPRLQPVGWSPDGRSLFLTYSARDRWDRGLVRYDLVTQSMEDLVRDESLYSGWRFSEDGRRIVYDYSDGNMPNDLFVADAEFARSRRLTNLNPWLADRTMTRSELVPYLDADGRRLYGILYYPVNYEPGRRYPLVAEIYEEFFNNGFNHRMNLIANAGYFGFRPSVHLETGFPGEAWLKGVTAGINTLVDRGLVDNGRLGVHGTSYGGYATNLLVTQTNRFAAAINISGKVNIISFLGDSPKITVRNYYAAESGQDRIGATLWEQPQKYLAHTAILAADRIETPLLLMSGEGDWNVPATNQREMYYALRRLGKEVVWVHYMNAGHGAGRSSTVADFHDHWERILEWYESHFYPEGRPASTTDRS